MAALNSASVSVPAQKYLFFLTDTNTRTEKRGERGGEVGSKVLGAYGRDVFNANAKLPLSFAKNDKLDFLSTFVCTPKSGVSYTFQNVNRSKGKTRWDYTMTKQADRPRLPLNAQESDHNLVYAKFCIPYRSAPN